MFFFVNIAIALNFFVATISAKETYNPDESLSVPKIIKSHGYPAETHIVDTKDGYLLAVHRIPHGKKTRYFRNFPVLLQHGILASSADWIINGPLEALAYQLADQGFDVWLGNSRGNTYSRTHKNLSPGSEQFWNFSFHEMGYYDLPATIDYILEHTNHTQLYYIGHSMGSCMFFVMCSMRPEYNYKIRMQISLAPVAYVHHMQSKLKILVPYADEIQKASNWLSNGAFLTKASARNTVQNYFTKYVVSQTIGEDSVQFNMTLLPIILAHTPAGTSVKTLKHFAQEIITNNFQQFDYGLKENIYVYNCSRPPKYNFSNIFAPIAFYYAKNDKIADPRDVMELYIRLPNRLHLIELDEFDHLDFLYGRNVFDMVYQNVINTMFAAESFDWKPNYDKVTTFKDLTNYTQCDESELYERNSTESIFDTFKYIISNVEKIEVRPLDELNNNENIIKSGNTYNQSWDKLYYE